MSKIIIKRPRLIHCWDNRLIDSDTYYTGFIFINQHKLPVNNSNKLLINISRILLKDSYKFPVVNIDIKKSQIYTYLSDNYNLDESQIKDIGLIYNIPNVKLYTIIVRYNSNLNIEGYTWRKYLDFYKKNEKESILDLYENILNTKTNSHIKIKMIPDNDIKLTIKLKRVYMYMIGDLVIM